MELAGAGGAFGKTLARPLPQARHGFTVPRTALADRLYWDTLEA